MNIQENIPKSHTAKCLSYCLIGEICTNDYINIFTKNEKENIKDYNFLRTIPFLNISHNEVIMEKFQSFYEKEEYKKDDILLHGYSEIHKFYIVHTGSFEILYGTIKTIQNLIGLSYLSEYIEKTGERFTEKQKFELKDKNPNVDLFKVMFTSLNYF